MSGKGSISRMSDECLMKGKQGKIENKDGSTSYFCYWDLKDTLSAKDDTTVVLFETTWTNKKVKTEIIKADEYIEE